MKAWLVLTLAVAAVVAGVMGLAAMIVPSSPEEPPVATGPDPGTTPSTSTPQAGPLTGVGGTISVTGDMEASLVVDALATGFNDNGVYRVADGDRTWMLLGQEGDRLTVDQASIEGRNFFLDAEDCQLDEQEYREDLGVSRVTVDCPEVTDVQGENTVTLRGHADIALSVAATDGRYPAGGVMAFDDGAPEQWEITEPYWFVWPETSGGEQFALSGTDPAGNEVGLSFNFDSGEPRVEGVGDETRAFRSPSGCEVSHSFLHPLAPDTDYMEVAVDCQDLVEEGGDTIATLTGTVRVFRVDPFSHP